MKAGPVFEDSIGAQLLTDVLTMSSNIKERHDTLEFVNHIYIHHSVRLVVNVDRGPSTPRGGQMDQAAYRAWGAAPLRTDTGRVVLPLGYLDRHSRATTHITDESGEIVPLFTAKELNHWLGSGLVCYADKALPGLTPDLVQHLREIPHKAALNLRPADLKPQTAADQAFDSTCRELLEEFPAEAVPLLKTLPFRLALAVVTNSVQLVVEVDPEEGSTRVFSYSYIRPINPQHDGSRRSRWDTFWRLLSKSGTTNLEVDLGPMGGCERYHLSADAPFDTWFAGATMERTDVVGQASEAVDTSRQFRLSYTQTDSLTPWSGLLRVDLRTVYTGVARAGVYASVFLLLCVVAGLVRVCLADDHALIPQDTDAAASLLLLFPGIAASAVAGAAGNTLTATLQFPIRLTLWCMSLISFVLATAAAFRLGGVCSIVLWALATAAMLAATITLQVRAKKWDQGRARET